MKRFAVLGSPIGHSRSPAMHSAAFEALGLDDHRYEAIETRPSELPSRLEQVRDGALVGVNLTVPLKRHALGLCAQLSPIARRVGAINTVWRHEDGGLIGHNTDAGGFTLGVRASGIDLRPRAHALVLGGGGAARAIVAGLLEAQLVVVWVARRPDELPGWGGSTARGWEELSMLEEPSFAVVVNATTVGMEGGPKRFPVALEDHWAAWGQPAVIDAVYPAGHDGLVARAQRLGLRAVDGLPMLWGQGVLALEAWLARSVPTGARRAMAQAIGLDNLDRAYM